MELNDLYFKNAEQRENCERFIEFVLEFPHTDFFFPNQGKAPWHVQCVVTTDEGYKVHVNFWPHKGKAQADGCKVREGDRAPFWAIEDAYEMEDITVIEDD